MYILVRPAWLDISTLQKVHSSVSFGMRRPKVSKVQNSAVVHPHQGLNSCHLRVKAAEAIQHSAALKTSRKRQVKIGSFRRFFIFVDLLDFIVKSENMFTVRQ